MAREDLINILEGHNSELYNNKREYDLKQINYKQYKSTQWAITLMKIDILLQLADLEGLPDSCIHKYRLNNDDPEIQKALLRPK